jgi:hypothetical protein
VTRLHDTLKWFQSATGIDENLSAGRLSA